MFDNLLGRDLLAILLSAEVLFCAVFTLSLFIAVHAMLTFMRQSTGLYTRLAEIDAELSVLHASIPGKLERIRTKRDELAPLKEEFRKIQEHYSRLQHMERLWLEQQDALDDESSSEEGSTDEERKIRRRQLGLDRFI